MSASPAGLTPGRFDYRQAVDYLYSLGWELKSAKFGLEGIRALVRRLGDPQHAVPAVQVAGTNGKGSVSAMIASGLRAAGLSTGLYTSPHLIEPVERIACNGGSCPPEEFAAAFEAIHQANLELLEEGQLEHHTTFFECVTAMAFWLFRRWEMEWAVLEVGLGGRLDATTVADPRLAVITRVDLDHEKILGPDVGTIAGEKAGILKPGATAVFAPQRPEAAAVLRARAAELQVRVIEAGDWKPEQIQVERNGSRIRLADPVLVDLWVPLRGAHQVENAITAAAALHTLAVPAPAIEAGIAATRWPGRLEQLGTDPEILADGAHNPSGAAALAGYLQRFYAGRPILLVFGCMTDKDAHTMLAPLAPLADRIVFTRADYPRSADPAELRSRFPELDATVTWSLIEAEPEIRNWRSDGLVVITGSLFLVGEARRWLLAEPETPGAAA